MKYRKSYRTKKKRSVWLIFKNKFFWFGLFILAVIGSLAYLFIFSSVFQIKDIQISGAEKSPAQEIKDIISAKSGNIFLTDFEAISKNLLGQYIEIANITLKRNLPNRVLVQIEERKPIALFCRPFFEPFLLFLNENQAEECYFLDKQGVIFEKVSEQPGNLLVLNTRSFISKFNLGQKIIDENYLAKVLEINSQLEKDIKIKEASLISEDRLNIKTSEGWEIYFNPKKDLDWQIEEIKILLEQKISLENRENLEYVDLRFEKVYIKRSN
jgi:cell division protein FtsQ